MIQDSGTRKKFESGAVRDIQQGKGRCDLLPLEQVANFLEYGNKKSCQVLKNIGKYIYNHDPKYIHSALTFFCAEAETDRYTMLLETSIHFEEGANKYAERNWEKGIDAHCYISSAVRHYLKWKRGDTDERHDRAFCWNLLCLLDTMEKHKELNDLPELEK